MRKFGLIGYPLGHSFSKGYFTRKFEEQGLPECQYENFPLEAISQLPGLIASEPDLVGLNVTIPYKQDVFVYLEEVDALAQEIGAVNTIRIERDGDRARLTGFNTDAYGFEQPLLEVLKPIHQSALILGTGGASKAVAYILRKHGIRIRYVSRTPKDTETISYEALTSELINDSKIIINCSPVGMHPRDKECPSLPYCSLTSDHILYDLVYNPLLTRFLEKGKTKKATLINGLPMLHLQAEKAWEIWNA